MSFCSSICIVHNSCCVSIRDENELRNSPQLAHSRIRSPDAIGISPSTNHSPRLKMESLLTQKVTRFCHEGNLKEALLLLQSESKLWDCAQKIDAMEVLVHFCGTMKEIFIGRKAHEIVSSSIEFSTNAVLNTRFITMYSLCGFPSESRKTFDKLTQRNLVHWNALISCYIHNKDWEEALSVFFELLSTNFTPDNFTLPCVIKACAELLSTEVGRPVHGLAMKMGLASNLFVGNALITMYGKCGLMKDSLCIFSAMPEKNLVSWNSIIGCFAENGLPQECFKFLRKLIINEMGPDEATMVILLPVCAGDGDVNMGRVVHGLSVRLGLDQELKVKNSLIDMYAKCGHLSEAELLFKKSLKRSLVSWNSIIDAYSKQGDVYKTLEVLRRMPMNGIRPNVVTILNVLPVCLKHSEFRCLKEIHGYVIRNGFHRDELLANALISAHAKCGLLRFADNIFHGIENKTVNTWNALISGYAQNDDSIQAIKLFLQMSNSGLKPDWFTIGSLLLSCTNLKNLKYGKEIHGYVLRIGIENDSFTAISLLSLYIRCDRVGIARELYQRMRERNRVSWNTMITGYSQNGYSNEALNLFRQMLLEKIQPCEISMVGALTACTQLLSLRLGKELHCFALKTYLTKDSFVSSSIIDMYSKCGCIEQSRCIFDRLDTETEVSWTVMISGYGIHGYGREAIELFERMKKKGLKPDRFTFIGVLMACDHAGLLKEGLHYFGEMITEYKLAPELEHYSCLLDMLARAGSLDHAAKIVDLLPEAPDSRVWSSILSGCKIYGNVDLGEIVAKALLELEPNKAENYVTVSNFYASSGKWEEMRRVRGKMKEMGLKKNVGCSWIDIEGKMHSFVTGDNTFAKLKDIHTMWYALEKDTEN